jgi:tRNA 2-thiouridine synthesizing protein A
MPAKAKLLYPNFNNHQDLNMSAENARLDATGLNCPLPILRAKKALNEIEVGRVLEITATDPGSIKDFEAFCQQTKNTLVSSGENDGVYVFEIERTN